MKVYTSYNQYTNGVTNNTLDKTLISNGDYVSKYLLKPIWSMTSSHEWCLVRTFSYFDMYLFIEIITMKIQKLKIKYI